VVGGITLGGSQQTHLHQTVVNELGASRVGGHGRIGKVALGTGELSANGVLTQPEQVLLAFSYDRGTLVAVTVDLAIAQGHGPTARCFLKIKTEILSRVVHRGRALYAHIGVFQDKIKVPVLTVVKTDFPHQLVCLLVVELCQGVHYIKRIALTRDLAAYRTRPYEHKYGVSPLRHHPHELVHAHTVTLVQDSVLLVKRAYTLSVLRIIKVPTVHYVVV